MVSNEMPEKKKYPVLRKVITLMIMIAVAWLLGQLAAPALLKAFFL